MMAAPTNVEITIITITEVPTAPSSSNNKLEFVVVSQLGDACLYIL